MKTEIELLRRLEKWYIERCERGQQHEFGLRINTLDNPGWALEADASQANPPPEDKSILSYSNDEEDWIYCKIENGRFLGAGDSKKLPRIIEVFLDYIEQNK